MRRFWLECLEGRNWHLLTRGRLWKEQGDDQKLDSTHGTFEKLSRCPGGSLLWDVCVKQAAGVQRSHPGWRELSSVCVI